MTHTELEVSDLPDGVVVRESARRRRTISVHREGGLTVVVVPPRMSHTQIRRHAKELHERITRRSRRTPQSDEALLARAEALRTALLPEAPAPASIRFSSRQRKRWGSCQTADRTILISARMIGMPDYVLDSVIFHELVHLLVPGHGPEFTRYLDRYADRHRADAYLDGVIFAQEEFGRDEHPDHAQEGDTANGDPGHAARGRADGHSAGVANRGTIGETSDGIHQHLGDAVT